MKYLKLLAFVIVMTFAATHAKAQVTVRAGVAVGTPPPPPPRAYYYRHHHRYWRRAHYRHYHHWHHGRRW